MKKIVAVLFILLFALPVCAKKRQSEEIITPVKQLEKRSFQTKTYTSEDKVLVMKSILNTFQDEGYLVYNVNSLLGFIYAVKDFDTSDPNIDISKEFGFTQARMNYNGITVATLEAVANITEYGDQVRTRLNFKRKLLNQYGNAQFISDIEEPEFYNKFYEKVSREISLQKQINEVKVKNKKEEILKQEEKSEVQDTEIQQDIKPENKEAPAEKGKVETIEENQPKIELHEEKQKSEKLTKEEKELIKQHTKELKELEKIQKKEAKEQARLEKELSKIKE